MTKQRARIRGDESGFTLMEMIITIIITSMIIGVLAAVFVTSANSTNATKQRSNQSNDAQVISSFLVKDAQAAGGITQQTGLNDPTLGVFTNTPATCTRGGNPITGTVLRLRWVDVVAGNTIDAVYWVSGNTLTRSVCTNGGSATDITLAKTIASASANCTIGGSTGACNNGVNGQPEMPDSVHLLITATNNPNPSGPALVGTYTLHADREPAVEPADGLRHPEPRQLGVSLVDHARIVVPGRRPLEQRRAEDLRRRSGQPERQLRLLRPCDAALPHAHNFIGHHEPLHDTDPAVARRHDGPRPAAPAGSRSPASTRRRSRSATTQRARSRAASTTWRTASRSGTTPRSRRPRAACSSTCRTSRSRSGTTPASHFPR